MDEKLNALIERFADDMENSLAENLVSLVLYGSAASGQYIPGKSDLNFLIVLASADEPTLSALFKPLRKWTRKGVALPFIMDMDDVQRSLDSFPVEFLEMKIAGRVVRGDDLLAGMVIDAEDLRLQCEREVKGKLLLLREAYLETAGRGAALKELARNSIPALIAIFEALLYLKGKEIPGETMEIVRVTAETFDLDTEVFKRLVEIRGKEVKLNDRETLSLFKAYLREMRKLSKLVDITGGQDE